MTVKKRKKGLYNKLLLFWKRWYTNNEYPLRNYTGKKHGNVTGIDETHLNCCCKDRSVLKGVREPFLYGFAGEKTFLPKFRETQIIVDF